jgi:hypothetical protein
MFSATCFQPRWCPTRPINYILSDQGMPVAKLGNSASLTSDVSYTEVRLNTQPIPHLLCSLLEPSYGVNIQQHPLMKSAFLGQTGYTCIMLYPRTDSATCNLINTFSSGSQRKMTIWETKWVVVIQPVAASTADWKKSGTACKLFTSLSYC